MITIKDFKVGDVVYALLSNRGRHAEPIIAEKVVVTVEQENSNRGQLKICRCRNASVFSFHPHLICHIRSVTIDKWRFFKEAW